MYPLDLGIGHFSGLCDRNRQQRKHSTEEREGSPGEKSSHGLTIAQTRPGPRKLEVMRQHRWIILCAFVSTGAAADYQIEANIRYAPYPETVLDILQPRAFPHSCVPR